MSALSQRIEILIERSCRKGYDAHFHVAQVVHAMFANQWAYMHPIGWRARTNNSLLVGPEAVLLIRRKLSEDVADAYEAFSNTDKFESALKIATCLTNAVYKNHIIEELESLFMEAKWAK